MEQNYHKRYYEDNKQYWRDYAKKNKEKIDRYIKEKFTCEVCGGQYTMKHQRRILQIRD